MNEREFITQAEHHRQAAQYATEMSELLAALEPFREDAETWLRMVTETAENTYPMREDTPLKDGRTVGDWVRLARAIREASA